MEIAKKEGWEEGGNCHYLVTGKCSDKINPEKMARAEADYMALVLNYGGIPEDKIHRDTIARNTWENFYLNKSLVEAINPRTIGIVTGYFHSYRSKRFAKIVYPDRKIVSYPVPIRNSRDFLFEAVSAAWELKSTIDTHPIVADDLSL